VSDEHTHDWAFDWENPPGYYCAVEGCDAVTGACDICEAPTAGRFCSPLCDAEDADTKGTP